MSKGRGWLRSARPPDILALSSPSTGLVMPNDGTISPPACAEATTKRDKTAGRIAPVRRRPEVARVIMRLGMTGLLREKILRGFRASLLCRSRANHVVGPQRGSTRAAGVQNVPAMKIEAL